MSGKGFGEYLTDEYKARGRRRTDAEAAEDKAQQQAAQNKRDELERWKPGDRGYERGVGRYLH